MKLVVKHFHFCMKTQFPVIPIDYVGVSSTLMFAACEKSRQCENITIREDTTLELTESFAVTLERTSNLNDSRITLSPVDGEIDIFDNDGRKYQEVYAISSSVYNI